MLLFINKKEAAYTRGQLVPESTPLDDFDGRLFYSLYHKTYIV